MNEFLHRHPMMESRYRVNSTHVIVDIADLLSAKSLGFISEEESVVDIDHVIITFDDWIEAKSIRQEHSRKSF